MVTLKEIAAQCGCSVATVSKALNKMPDISAKTARRICDMAMEMGYLPNAAARTLKTSRSRTIGLLLFLRGESVWTHDYFAEIAASIQTVMGESGYDITPINCDGASVMGSYLDYCRYRSYDGIIVMSAGFTEKYLLELIDSEIPLVTIDYAFHHRGAVLSDNVQGMRDLVRYVHAKGHRRIAFIHGEDTSVTRNRLASFYTTAEELNVSVPDEYVRPAFYHDPDSSARATRRLLELPQRPTCILYPDDYSYVGGMNELLNQGMRIPEDISVAGYDGIRLAEILRPRLTTLRQDSEGIGRHAARMLLKAIEKPRSFISQHVTLPGRIMEGETVGSIDGDAR